MASYNKISEIEIAIKRELPLVMEDEVKEQVENAIKWATSVVYSYNPIYYNRRMSSGGLSDPNTYEANYYPSEQELIIDIKTPWQNVGFRRTTGEGTGDNELADVIEKNRIYHAPPRPFLRQAEEIVKSRKSQLEQIVADYLNKTV